MLRGYFKSLYQRTMREAYARAIREIVESVGDGKFLDCGAGDGNQYSELTALTPLSPGQYFGVEWHPGAVELARARGLNVSQGDLNAKLPFDSDSFSCVYGLSVLEHLLHPCHYLREAHRVLQPGGRLVVLTPNISTYFTALLILLGKMPSSGPHPDSDLLIKSEEVFKVSSDLLQPDTDSRTPRHRHLVVFSYRVLQRYLGLVGFREIRGYGFGVYPFPNWMQPMMERLDPWHCHQMVFVATK